MTYYTEVTADSPVEEWRMDETSGSTVASTGSGAHSGTATGTTISNGIINKGRVFNGTSDSIAVSSVADFTAQTNYTFEAWFKITSTDTGSTDWREIARRDGSGAWLVRVAGSTAGIQQGSVQAYLQTRTINTGSTRFDDGNWHHVVVVKSGSTPTLYVDGTSYGSGTGTIGSAVGTAQTLKIGSDNNASAEFFKGSLDSVAIYHTALSGARISAHYAAAFVNVSAAGISAMTGTGTFPGGVKVVDVEVAANPFVGSTGSMPTAVPTATLSNYPTLDYRYDQFGTVNSSEAASLVHGGTQGGGSVQRAVLKFPTLSGNPTVDSATLRLTASHVGMSVSIYPILANFTVANVTDASFTLGTPITVTPSNGVNNINVADLLDEGLVYGFLIKGNPASSDYVSIDMSETTGTANDPQFSITYHFEVIDASYSAAPMTVTTGTFPTPSVSTQVSVSYSADAMTATTGIFPTPSVTGSSGVTITPFAWTGSASAPTAAVEAQHDGGFTAEPMYAAAEMPGGLFSYSVGYTASAMTAGTGVMPTATVVTQLGIAVNAVKMTGTARMVGASEVNGNPIASDGSNDNYFRRVDALNPSAWVRMTDTGRVLYNRQNGQAIADVYNLVTTGKHDGPDGRASLEFVGNGSIEQREVDPTIGDEYITYAVQNQTGDIPHTFEFSLRTTRANEFVLGGSDGYLGSNGVASQPNTFSEVNLVNGVIQIRQYTLGSQGGVGFFNNNVIGTGFRRVDDGDWHHIVLRGYNSKINRNEIGFEVWIDGTLEFRRLVRGTITFAWPDYVGYRPTTVDGIPGDHLPALTSSQIFRGDLSEMVYYANRNLADDDITRNYYAFMGYVPIEAEAMEGSAAMPTSKGKGNQKKALYLYWKTRDEVFTTAGGAVTGTTTTPDNTNFDPNPALQNSSYGPVQRETTTQFAGYQVKTKSVTVNYEGTYNPIEPYRDRVTDEQTIIDLERDVDLSEYDLIMFKDWPDEAAELDEFGTDPALQSYPTGAKDRFIKQLLNARANGINLLVTNPRMAMDLGIINRYDWCYSQIEVKNNSAQGENASGNYDYGSAVKFPWNITNSDGLSNGATYATGIGQAQITTPSYLANKAYFYFDNNRNNKFRLRAKVDGITDLKSYMLQDAVFHVDADTLGWQGAALKLMDRTDHGLDIGDEWIYNGASVVNPFFLDSTAGRYNRTYWTPATPISEVKVGTVVTTFSSTLWTGSTVTDNPFKDHATTIVIDQTDLLDGRTGGRVFVNFTEQPGSMGIAKQVLPHTAFAAANGYGDLKWPRSYGGVLNDTEGAGETPAQMDWDYSWTRTTLSTTQTNPPVSTIQVVTPDGTINSVRTGRTGGDDRLYMVRSSQLFPVVGVSAFTMIERGFNWLRSAPEFNEGDMIIRVAPMTATAEAPTATAAGQKSVTVQAFAMTATARMPEADEAKSGNAEYLATAMTATGTFAKGGQVNYNAEAMTGTATMPEINSATTGQAIVLRLPRVEKITLRMEAR